MKKTFLGKPMAKAISFIICFAMIFTNSIMIGFADAEQEGQEPVVASDYMRQSLVELDNEDLLQFNSEVAEVSVNEKTESLVFKGDTSTLLGEKFLIDKEFNFEENAVDRFSFCASTVKGAKVTIAFYLDDETEPFVTAKLYKQKKKGSWSLQKDYSANIADLKLLGKHKLSFAIVSSDKDTTEFVFKYFEFVEGSVPVVYFDLDESEGTIAEMNSDYNHEAECYGKMSISVPEGYVSVDSDKALEGGEYKLEYIRGRGNSTWDADKKPYKIKLDKKADLLGLGKNKHWVLLANYYDNSLVRNRITYWLGDQVGMAYTPASEPVDVVMNNEYLGSYFLCEQIRVGKNRVEIDDLEDTPDAFNEPEVTGGYLLGMCPYDEEETKKVFSTDRGLQFIIESPELTVGEGHPQYEYIKNYFQSVENAIYGKDFKDENGVYYGDLMDLESTAMYYWFQEFSMNGDGYGSPSTYLYKPREDKLYWGPLWDFDYVAWGSTEYTYPNVQGWTHGVDSYSDNWIPKLMDDKQFTSILVKDWNETLKPAIESLIAPGGQLDNYAENMAITARYNFEKWGYTELDWEDQPELTYSEEIERLRTWINGRMEWVDKNVDALCPEETTITLLDENGGVYKTVPGLVGRQIGKLPEGPKKKGYIFSGWQYDFKYNSLDEYFADRGTTQEEFVQEFLDWGFSQAEVDEMLEAMKEELEGTRDVSSDTIVFKNMVLNPTYMDEADVVKAKKINFEFDKYYALYDEYDTTIFIEAQVTPFDTTFPELNWESSDESIAKVDEGGMVTVFKPGDVTIKASIPDGPSASVGVHVYSYDEYEALECPERMIGDVQPSVSLKKGAYTKLRFDGDEDEGQYYGSKSLIAVNPEIVEVGQAGMIHALKAGETIVISISNDCISLCKVKVTDNNVRVNEQYTVNGIKYKVTEAGKDKEVKAIGVTKAKAKDKSLTVPQTVNIKDKKFKVTEIGKSAFAGMKKVTKVSIGSNVEIIGKKAFSNCKALKSVSIKGKSVKIYSNSFSGVNKKVKYKVKKSQLKYYKLVLPKKKVFKIA